MRGNRRYGNFKFLDFVSQTKGKQFVFGTQSNLMTCEPGNTGKQSISITCEPANTETRTILMTWEPWNTAVLWVSELILWVSELIPLYFGCLNLYFGWMNLYFGCLNLYRCALDVWTYTLGVWTYTLGGWMTPPTTAVCRQLWHLGQPHFPTHTGKQYPLRESLISINSM